MPMARIVVSGFLCIAETVRSTIYTFIEGVRRGNFRLHPIGPRGLSEGCITLSHITDFDYLRNRLLKTSMINVPGSLLMAYGTIRVD